MASSAPAWLDRLFAALPTLLVLGAWATLRGRATTATYLLFGIAIAMSLLSLPQARLLLATWLGTSIVVVAIFRERPLLGLRLAAATSAVLIATLAALGV